MELIDRTVLLEKSYYRGRPATVDHPWGDGAEVVDVEDIEALPIINAVPIVHGRWIVEVDGSFRNVKCSACGKDYACHTGMLQLQNFSYCPNCSAKMDLEE